MSQVEALSRDDLIKIVNRDRWVKEMLTSRIATLVAENVELLGIVREFQIMEQQAQQEQSQEVQVPEDGDIPQPV